MALRRGEISKIWPMYKRSQAEAFGSLFPTEPPDEPCRRWPLNQIELQARDAIPLLTQQKRMGIQRNLRLTSALRKKVSAYYNPGRSTDRHEYFAGLLDRIVDFLDEVDEQVTAESTTAPITDGEIGRASCRERV